MKNPGETVVLASDLDGTLIPLDNNAQNEADLRLLANELRGNGMPLIFVTGRHLESVLAVAGIRGLPAPEWIICDVGSAIYECREGEFFLKEDYAQHLRDILQAWTVEVLDARLLQVAGLTRQEQEKQTEFKLSYYTPAEALPDCTARIERMLLAEELPFSVISSVDPFDRRGLIDLLPQHVSKAYALHWWCQSAGCDREQVLYAGDSGNDTAVFAAGYRAIVVGNASRDVLQAAEESHRQQGWKQRLYAAQKPATSGVLEGVRYFLNIAPIG